MVLAGGSYAAGGIREASRLEMVMLEELAPVAIRLKTRRKETLNDPRGVSGSEYNLKDEAIVSLLKVAL